MHPHTTRAVRLHRVGQRCAGFGLALALVLASLALACSPQSNTPQKKEVSMHVIETEKFTWETSVSNYNVDKGAVRITTLLPENWFKDAAGNVVRQFYGSSNGWGIGTAGIGGGEVVSALPKTFSLSYYDYVEDAFYKLEAELDQRRLYEYFKQKSFQLSFVDKPFIKQRFNTLTFGIAPRGNIMLWVGQEGGQEQVELASYQAQRRTDMTPAKYNERGPAFEIRIEDRWEYMTSGAGALSAETIKRIKAGQLPLPDRYMLHQRLKYPWRYRLSGNATLVEYKARFGNAENATVWPYELAKVQATPMLRGAPRTAQLFFLDKRGERHSVFVEFFTKDRVAGEPDLDAVFKIMNKLFPGRTLEKNSETPKEEDMATLDIHVGDDLQSFTATLIKGDVRIPMPLAPNSQVLDLAPTAHYSGKSIKPYSKEQQKLLLEGPGDLPVGDKKFLLGE